MNRTPEQQWSALSALYEEADGLRADELPTWMEQLEREGNPLLPQLKLMLQARSHLETNDFLGTLPKLSSDAANASDWHEGDRVGPYRLVKPLGEGGMAEVWLADRADGAFKRQVAIKLPYPRPGRETFAARFDRERDILATLRHPHIAGLFDAGVTKDGQAWLALEYVEGQSISTFCDERKLPLRERVQLFRQVLLAVQHAHANLVIHRDLKPGNILVTVQGEVRLLDFGIAKLLEAQGNAIEETELTRQAGRSMTPRYASPEQLMGLPLTTACDVYSLGVVFYELICGERPYELKVESAAQLEHSILEVEPRAPSRRHLSEDQAQIRGVSVNGLRKELVPELDAISLRCLEKKPSARYSSVDALLADVDRWLSGDAVLARPPGTWYRFGKFAKRHRIGVGLATAGVLSLAMVAAIAVVFGIQAREDSARAGAARDFMLSLFKRADQEKARGAEITARELLDTGRKDVLKRLSNQPRLQAELLDGIANIQKDMGEYVGADATFADAAQIYSQLGMPREEALARTAEANVAVRMGDMRLAEAAVQQARGVSGYPSNDPELAARMNEVEGWIAFIHGNSQLAKDKFVQSHLQALKAFGPYHTKTIDALRGQAYAEQQLRNFDAALSILTRIEEAASKSPTTDAKEFSALAIDRADLLYVAGRHSELNSHVIGALARCNADLGPHHADCRSLLIRKVRALLRLGLSAAALQELPALTEIAEDRKAPVLRTEALLLILKLDMQIGSNERKSASFDQVRVLAETDAGASLNRNYKVKALLALAEARLMAGDPGGAQVWVQRVLDGFPRGDVSSRPSMFEVVARSFLGISHLEKNQRTEAVQVLSTVRSESVMLVGPNHPTTHFFSLNLAVALEQVGRFDDARVLVADAEDGLRGALGPDTPTFQRIRGFHARLDQQASSMRFVRPVGTFRGSSQRAVDPAVDLFF